MANVKNSIDPEGPDNSSKNAPVSPAAKQGEDKKADKMEGGQQVSMNDLTEEKKPDAPAKTAADSKAAPANPTAKTEAAKKPAEPSKDATDNKAAPAAPAAKTEQEKNPAEPSKATTDNKAAPAAPAAKTEPEKKPAEPGKDAKDGKAAPAAPVAKTEPEKKPAEPGKDAKDSKTAPAAPAAKTEQEKKPTEPGKGAKDGKAAPAAAKTEQEKKPAEPGKDAKDGKAAPAAKTDDKPPFDVDKPGDKKDAPAEPAIDPKNLKLEIGATEADKITMMNISELHFFEGHPFKVEDNKDMYDLADSIKMNGVMEPAVVIPRKEGGYEIVSGHRRMRASQLAGLTSMPVIVRNLDRDEAVISMVDANLRRENISPMDIKVLVAYGNGFRKKQEDATMASSRLLSPAKPGRAPLSAAHMDTTERLHFNSDAAVRSTRGALAG